MHPLTLTCPRQPGSLTLRHPRDAPNLTGVEQCVQVDSHRTSQASRGIVGTGRAWAVLRLKHMLEPQQTRGCTASTAQALLER